MAKDLRTFIADCQRELPGESDSHHQGSQSGQLRRYRNHQASGAQKKFPIIIFDNPLNLNGKVGPIKLTMNCEISQGKTQIAWACRALRRGHRWPKNVWRWKSIGAADDHSEKRTRRSRRNTMVGDQGRPLSNSDHAPS
jgi:hypothetical protein